MSMAVKLSDDLITEARAEAEASDRSLTSQIEHWARLGREIESVLQHDDVLNLKRAGQQKVSVAPLAFGVTLTVAVPLSKTTSVTVTSRPPLAP